MNKNGYLKIPNRIVWLANNGQISLRAFMLYCLILSKSSITGSYCIRFSDKLAKKQLGCRSRETVSKAFKELEMLEFIKLRIKRRKLGNSFVSRRTVEILNYKPDKLVQDLAQVGKKLQNAMSSTVDIW